MDERADRPVAEEAERREWWREAVTMALYVSVSLLAVLVALPSEATRSASDAGMTILVTAIALLLAHQVAFRLSSRLVNRGLLDASASRLLVAQAGGGLAAAAVAALPVFVLGPDGIRVSEFLLLAFVAATGYRSARSIPTSRARALSYVIVVVLVVVGILLVKGLAGH